MGYRWVDHVGEMELHIEAATEEAVFVDALRAVGALMSEDDGGERVSWVVDVSGAEREALLVGWLDELAFRAEMEGLVPDDVDRLELCEERLSATVRGHRGEPPHLIKAATYHGLAFERDGGGYRATVVLDV
jgi:SHS2 domain-containing protein